MSQHMHLIFHTSGFSGTYPHGGHSIGFPITVYLLECKMYQDAITCSEKVTTYNTELFWLGVGPLK
jgi:hypothetical protein